MVRETGICILCTPKKAVNFVKAYKRLSFEKNIDENNDGWIDVTGIVSLHAQQKDSQLSAGIPPTVRTTGGVVSGRTEGAVSSFKGIPQKQLEYTLAVNIRLPAIACNPVAFNC